jgi:hypothetical protein
MAARPFLGQNGSVIKQWPLLSYFTAMSLNFSPITGTMWTCTWGKSTGRKNWRGNSPQCRLLVLWLVFLVYQLIAPSGNTTPHNLTYTCCTSAQFFQPFITFLSSLPRILWFLYVFSWLSACFSCWFRLDQTTNNWGSLFKHVFAKLCTLLFNVTPSLRTTCNCPTII